MNKKAAALIGMGLALLLSHAPAESQASYVASNDSTVSDISYYEYQQQYREAAFCGDEIVLNAAAYSAAAGVEYVENLDGKPAVITGEESYIQWGFKAENAGLYRLDIEYYNVEGTGGTMGRAVYIDDALPFEEAYNINFHRIYKDDGVITTGNSGDDFRPKQLEVKQWQTAHAKDQFGYFGEALYIYLTPGAHSLTLVALREPLALNQLKLVSEKVTFPSYEEYLNDKLTQGITAASGVLGGGIAIVSAEAPYEKSHPSLYAVNDNTSTNTTPYDPAHKKLNAIGGTRWNQSGQWISWEIEVPQDGLYCLGARSKQNVYRDMVSARALYIDGAIPFLEAMNLNFAFSDQWMVETFGPPEGYLFYLTAGKHVITLSVALGNIADVLMQSSEILKELNRINLQLIALMGTTPDEDRDYRINVFMPELLEWITREKLALENVRAELLLVVENSDKMIAQLDQLIFQMDEMAKKPERIAELFGRYRELIRAFGNWIMEAREKPLLLDYLFVSEAGAKLPAAEHGLLARLWDGTEAFLASFYVDYTSLSGKIDSSAGEEVITVWIGAGLSGGRDQAIALSKMIVDDFTKNTGVHVNLQLVPGGTILTATLAGNGPDVALQLDGTAPVNYAMRNALYDLKRFSDFDETITRFPASARTPFEYGGGIYALPETFSFPMLFYRTDILRDLKVNAAQLKTWNDVVSLLPTLQRQNMTFGLFPDMTTYLMFLYQRNGSLYNDDLSASALDTKTAIEAFTYWMEFYTNYGLERDYNFVDRFRTGEMPIGIADYTTYNLLSVSAPEISGHWKMIALPGIRQSDGTVNSVAPSGGSGAVIMSATRNPDAAWEFLKWWTSADVQYAYGMELEAVMGVGARYNTANINAFNKLPWTAADRRNLLIQMDNTQGTPQVPGGYYTSRYLDFAKIAVYDKKRNPKDVLLEYVDEINSEIKQKLKEFGLD